MSETASKYSTEELSRRTWPDFERLFGRYGGVQDGCWCMFYHRAGPSSGWRNLSRQDRVAKNRSDKNRLVEERRSHGILVYSKGDPIGWCQFGPKEELSRIDSGRKYKKLRLGDNGQRLWRITCFFVHKDFRRRGVARAALRAALDAIKKSGGGLVEAYPATDRRAVAIWFGTASMFEKEGFRKISDFGTSNIVMWKEL